MHVLPLICPCLPVCCPSHRLSAEQTHISTFQNRFVSSVSYKLFHFKRFIEHTRRNVLQLTTTNSRSFLQHFRALYSLDHQLAIISWTTNANMALPLPTWLLNRNTLQRVLEGQRNLESRRRKKEKASKRSLYCNIALLQHSC